MTVGSNVTVAASALASVVVALTPSVTVPVPVPVVYVPNAVIRAPAGTPVITRLSPTASDPDTVETIVTVGLVATQVAVPENLLPVVCNPV